MLSTVAIVTILSLGFTSFLLVSSPPQANAETLNGWTPTDYPGHLDLVSCAVSGPYVYCVGGQNLSTVTASAYYGSMTSTGVTAAHGTQEAEAGSGWGSC
jgi:hypothetical protein